MFNSSNEDEDLFIPQNSSNLAGLFGVTPSFTSGNADLTYVAPKQPKNTSKPQSKVQLTAKPQNSVLFAKVASVFKSDGDVRKLIGKYGLALVGDASAKEIMLYKDKQNILAKITFTSDFEIHIVNECINLRDNNQEEWNVQFEEQKSLSEFLDKLKTANVKVVKEERSRKSSTNVDNTDGDVKNGEQTEQTRADILSRMAKMGQSILPGNIISKNADVDNGTTSMARKHSTSDANENFCSINYQLTNENERNNNINQAYYTPSNTSSQLSPFVPGTYTPERLPNTVISSQEFHLFTSENRIQNTEMRINLNSVSNKLDNVLSELSKIREPNTDKLENEFLKSKISDLEKNVSDLTKQLQESNNTTNNKHSDFEIIIENKEKQIQNEKDKVTELEKSLKNKADLQIKLGDFESVKDELNRKICILEEKLHHSENDVQKSNANLQENTENLLKQNKELHEKITLLERENKENLKEAVKGFSDIIKDSMNMMYQNITSQLDDSLRSGTNSILSTNIKQTTFAIILRFQRYLSNNSLDDGEQPTNNH